MRGQIYLNCSMSDNSHAPLLCKQATQDSMAHGVIVSSYLVGRRRVDSRVRPSGNHRRPIDHRCPADILKKARAESERGL